MGKLREAGLGDQVDSWVSTGQNQPVTGAQVHQAFGPETLGPIAAKLGISTQELAQKLSGVLPQAIDHLTPNGTVPPAPPAS